MNFKATYTYSFPTNIRFGIGVVNELGAYLKGQNLSAPLLVTDPNVAELGFLKKIIADLKDQGLKPEVFCDIHKNPVKSDVIKGVGAYHQALSDSIIGIGGGAGMDVARAIALGVNHTTKDLFEYDELIGGDKFITEPIPHFVTIPTTSGTGSEVGRAAIISEDDTRKKRILFHQSLLAKQVFADPALTFELPPFITAATGMDALTHNIEAFLSRGYHPMAEGIALEGIRLIFASLEKAVNNPDPESRCKMMIASLMGAVAFQKGLGVVHSLAHPLSTLLDMHHGLANAIMIPYGMRFNIAGFETQFARIANAMGLGEETGDAVVERLYLLNKNIGLPKKLGEQGVEEKHIEELADLAFADFCHPNNPKPVTRDDFRKMYLEAL